MPLGNPQVGEIYRIPDELMTRHHPTTECRWEVISVEKRTGRYLCGPSPGAIGNVYHMPHMGEADHWELVEDEFTEWVKEVRKNAATKEG